MSRTPGASVLLDVRTTAIMQDYVLSTNPCAPGIADAVARRRVCGGYLLENCQPPVCGYDRSRDMVSCIGAMCIVATVIGIVHSASVFIPSAVIEYNAGYLELCLINAMTYFMLLITACITYALIDYTGHKLTALFGMIFVFIGVLLESQVYHISLLYITNIIFVGIGGGMAYAAAVTLPSDLFRAKILTGAMIVNIAGSVGTIFYTWLIVEVIEIIGFKWAKMMLAMIVLFFTLGVHVFPKTRLMYTTGCDIGGNKTVAIQDCVYKVTTPEKDKCDDERSFLCVCVCDLRLYQDRSFILWSSLVMLAAMNFQIPYLFIVSYAETVSADITAWYITAYCFASIGTRCVFINNPDYTFVFNRTVFQGCLLVSGLMWVIMNWAITRGWILVMCGIMGAIEGTLCIVTSRVAIGTIPRQWLGGAWVSSIVFHSVGMFITTVFTAVIAMETFHFYVAFMVIGIIQIIVAFLAILLPNEDDEAVGTGGGRQMNQIDPCASILRGKGSNMNYNYMRSSYGKDRGASTASTTGSTKRPDYKCNCPVCAKYGCIAECLPECTPAGSLGKC